MGKSSGCINIYIYFVKNSDVDIRHGPYLKINIIYFMHSLYILIMLVYFLVKLTHRMWLLYNTAYFDISMSLAS